MKAIITINIKTIGGVRITPDKENEKVRKAAEKFVAMVADSCRKVLLKYRIRSDVTQEITYG